MNIATLPGLGTTEMNLPELWDFQELSIERLRDRLRDGHKGVVLCSPTGSGKTEISKAMIASAVMKGSRALFLVDGIDLMNQTSRRFHEAGIEHGVHGAGQRYGSHNQVIVAMIQTLIRMPVDDLIRYIADFDIVFWDESQMGFARLSEALERATTPYIGLSATPLRRGMGKTFDGGLVQVTTPNRLIEEGRLVKPIFRLAVEIDMTNAPLVNGEWEADEVQRRGRPSSATSWERGSRRPTSTSAVRSRRCCSPPPSRTARNCAGSFRARAMTSGR